MIRELKPGIKSDEDGSVQCQLARLYTKVGDRADAAIAIQQTKVFQQKRRQDAVIAIEYRPPAGVWIAHGDLLH